MTQPEEFTGRRRAAEEIWGFADIELLPVRLFVVATKVGGQAFGAYDGDRMVGFLPGDSRHEARRQVYLHSHMLGVLPEYRDTGMGRMLKLRQREDALARGIELMEWTFDPLEIKNAYFNMERLGRSCAATCAISTAPPPAICTADCLPTAARPSGGSRASA